MNKIIFIISMLCLVSVASAGTLDLNVENIDNGYLDQDGITYRILDDRYFSINYLGGGSTEYRRIIVEDFDSVEQLEQRIRDVFYKIDSLNKEIAELKVQISLMKEEKTELTAELEELQKERDEYKAELDSLEKEKNELENTMTSNFIVSPVTYQIGLAVFIILLVITIIVKSWQYIRS